MEDDRANTPDPPRCDALPHAVSLPFASFNNKHLGQSCYIIGRGPTDFDYHKLSGVTDPIFFINDAICLEHHVKAESFFFSHDPQPMVWLDNNPDMKSTAVLPIDGKLFRNAPDKVWDFRGKVVYYHWPQEQPAALLLKSREEIAGLRQLYINSATIHSLLHFAWFCGFTRVNLIGCDGLIPAGGGYDPRLENRSGVPAGPFYPLIRRLQDMLLLAFGIEAVYVGTPANAAEALR